MERFYCWFVVGFLTLISFLNMGNAVWPINSFFRDAAFAVPISGLTVSGVCLFITFMVWLYGDDLKKKELAEARAVMKVMTFVIGLCGVCLIGNLFLPPLVNVTLGFVGTVLMLVLGKPGAAKVLTAQQVP